MEPRFESLPHRSLRFQREFAPNGNGSGNNAADDENFFALIVRVSESSRPIHDKEHAAASVK